MRRYYVGLGAMAVALLSGGCAYGTDPGYPVGEVAADTEAGAEGGETANLEGDNASLSTFDPKDGWATSYMVLIDPTFGSQDQEVLIQAIGVWQAAVPVQFSVWMSACTTAAPGQICIHNGADYADGGGPGENIPNIWGYTQWTTDHADIYMYLTYSSYWGTSNIPDGFWETTLHEMGHAQGLVHHTGYYVMDPCGNCGPMPFTLTADDANQWLSLRGYPTLPEDAGLPVPQAPVVIPGTGQ